MPEKPPNTGRAYSDPTELERAIGACRSAFAVCAMFSLAINLLMLASPIYMLQVYDRVLTTGRVETLVMLTLIVTIALVVMVVLLFLRSFWATFIPGITVPLALLASNAPSTRPVESSIASSPTATVHTAHRQPGLWICGQR